LLFPLSIMYLSPHSPPPFSFSIAFFLLKGFNLTLFELSFYAMRWISGSNFVMGTISFKFLIEDSGVFFSFNKFYGFESFIFFSFLKQFFLIYT